MTLLQITKILGLVLTTICSIIGVFGETTTKGKINYKGFAVLSFLILGLITSISIEIMEQKAKIVNDTMQEEWSAIEEKNLFNFDFSIAFQQEYNPIEFISIAKNISVKISSIEPNDSGKFTLDEIKIVELDSDLPLKDKIKLAIISSEQEVKTGTYFYPYYRDFNFITDKDAQKSRKQLSRNAAHDEIFPLTVVSKSLLGFDWLYTTNLDIQWTKNSSRLCGFEANVPWKFIKSITEISKIKDFTNIATITIEIPSEIEVEKLDELLISFHTSDDNKYGISLSELFKKNQRKNILRFSGNHLYNLVKDDFYSKNKVIFNF